MNNEENKNNINENVDLEDKDITLEDLSKEDLIDIIYSMQERPKIDIKEIENSKINIEEFNKGVNIGSLYGGLFVSLVSCGIDGEQAYNIVLNQNTLDGNLKSSKLTNINSEKNIL